MADYQQVLAKINKFNQARGWTPEAEDLAKSICIEAAELLEHFQWDSSGRTRFQKPKNWQEISLEAADVFWYLATFCQKTGIDLPKAVENKIKLLEKKYPEKDFNGKFNPRSYYKNKAKYRQKSK